MGGAGIEANAATGLQFDPVEGDVRGEGRDNFLIQMAKASGRPLNYGGVSYSEANPERYKEQLAYLERAHKEGANLFAQASGVQVSPVFELAEYNGFDALPNWIDPFIGTPEERIAKLNTPGVRDKMKQDVGGEWTGIGGTADVAANWTKMRVVEVRKDSNLQYEGMNIAELAEATGKHPMDAMLDLAIDEDLRTEFSTDPTTGTDPEAMKEILNHPYTHPCISDGGAHVRYLTVGIWPVNFLTMWARDHEAMSLEKAHYKMSGLPAFIAGFTDRGVLKEGFAADIIVYDLDKLGLQYDSPIYDDDFPGGERRLIQKAKGIRYTLVNGGVTFTEGTVCTDATPGKLLRSYDMVSR
jgi:N-acyl-D-aspartate/D-glutamate deacylase